MVETITPVVHGGRRGRWAVAVGLHVLGAVASASALGAFLAAAGRLLGAPWGPAGPAILAVVAAAYAARELFGVPVPVPEARRQVPEWWRWTFPPFAASFLYGLGLGIGFLTHLRHGTLVAVAVAVAASGDPVASAVAMGTFGLARSVPLALTGPRTADGSGPVRKLEAVGASAAPRAANGLALVALSFAAVSAATGAAGQPMDLAAATLALVFGWAAASKAIRPGVWREAIAGYRLGLLARPAAILVPFAEAAVVAMLFAGSVRGAGILAAALVVSFTAAIVRSRESRLPCGCFGRRRRVDARILVARNLALFLVAAAVMVRPAWPLAPLPSPDAASVLPLILTATGIALTVFVARHVASLLTR